LSVLSESLLPTLASAFGVAVLGSGHCFAMCGAIAAMRGPRRAPAYQAGRLAGYATIGALAGAAGDGALRLLERSPGLQIALLVSLTVLVLLQAIAWWRGVPDRSIGATASRGIHARLFGRVARAAARNGGAFSLGFGTALVPCGWIASFALVAAATGSALAGAGVFAALWAGSLPALLAAAAGFSIARERLRRPLLRRATAVLMAVVGLGAVAHRWNASNPVDPQSGAHCGTIDPAGSR
jgi:sulfite exporter TauE/SafE